MFYLPEWIGNFCTVGNSKAWKIPLVKNTRGRYGDRILEVTFIFINPLGREKNDRERKRIQNRRFGTHKISRSWYLSRLSEVTLRSSLRKSWGIRTSWTDIWCTAYRKATICDMCRGVTRATTTVTCTRRNPTLKCTWVCWAREMTIVISRYIAPFSSPSPLRSPLWAVSLHLEKNRILIIGRRHTKRRTILSASGKTRSHHGRGTQPNANWSDASYTGGATSGAAPGFTGAHHGAPRY